MIVVPGQIWSDTNGNEFQIIDVTNLKGNTWVHYINKSNQEFSCYKESFIGRFFPLLNKEYNP